MPPTGLAVSSSTIIVRAVPGGLGPSWAMTYYAFGRVKPSPWPRLAINLFTRLGEPLAQISALSGATLQTARLPLYAVHIPRQLLAMWCSRGLQV